MEVLGLSARRRGLRLAVAGATCHDPWLRLGRAAPLRGRPRASKVSPPTIRHVALPSAAPDILAGMRLGLTVALVLAVVCEMLAAREGLGNWILLAARSFRAPDLYAGVILLGALGYLSSVFLVVIERYLLDWRSTGEE
ncbi:MAG: ABC transporter permease [Janthinobacterium lividum]